MEIKPKCKKCGGCCKSPFIAFEGIDLDKGDPLELVRYYNYHNFDPMQKVIGGKRVLCIRIPIPCNYLDEETGLCVIYDNRPIVCRDYFCEKAIGDAIKVVGE